MQICQRGRMSEGKCDSVSVPHVGCLQTSEGEAWSQSPLLIHVIMSASEIITIEGDFGSASHITRIKRQIKTLTFRLHPVRPLVKVLWGDCDCRSIHLVANCERSLEVLCVIFQLRWTL